MSRLVLEGAVKIVPQERSLGNPTKKNVTPVTTLRMLLHQGKSSVLSVHLVTTNLQTVGPFATVAKRVTTELEMKTESLVSSAKVVNIKIKPVKFSVRFAHEDSMALGTANFLLPMDAERALLESTWR